VERHPWNSDGRGGANTCVCYRFYMVSFLLNILVLLECLSFSWCSKIGQAALLFVKVGILIRCLFIYSAFDLSLVGNCSICFAHFKCSCSEQLNLAALDF
jgi:hypothetical protein